MSATPSQIPSKTLNDLLQAASWSEVIVASNLERAMEARGVNPSNVALHLGYARGAVMRADPAVWGEGIAELELLHGLEYWQLEQLLGSLVRKGLSVEEARKVDIKGLVDHLRSDQTPPEPAIKRKRRQRRCRLRVRGQSLFLDGEPVALNITAEGKREEALLYLALLIKEGGNLLSAGDAQRADHSLDGIRIDRLIHQLPETVRNLLETVPNRGTRLRSEAWNT